MVNFNRTILVVCIALCTVYLWSFTSIADDDEPTALVSTVVIVGNQRVNENTIRDIIQMTEGEFYSPEAARSDTQKLMDSGEFETVDISREVIDGEVIVTYRLTERPLITAIAISGNNALAESRIRNEINSRTQSPLNTATVRNDIERIRQLYARRGYAEAQINYTLHDDIEHNAVELTFTIQEGVPSYVRQVHVSGNESISDFRIKWAMQTKPRNLLLFQRGVFDPFTLQEDTWRIRELFQRRGFAEAQVTADVRPTEAQDGLAIYITVEEGPPHVVGNITIRQAKLTGIFATNLFYEVEIHRDGVFSPQAVEENARKIRDYYRGMGYADAHVIAKSLLSDDSTDERKVVDVFFEVTEDSLYDFGNVYITGNTRTKDVVIRRELNILPGNRYNFYRLETSRQRLMNLNYFEKVDVREISSRSIPNAKDVYIDVEEKRTGKIGFGAGYSSVDEFVGFVEISQANFDAFNWRNWFVGGGQRVRLRGELGTKRQDVIFSFTEPYFLYETLRGHKVSAGFDAFWRNHQFLAPDYQLMRVGGDLRAGTPVPMHWLPYVGKYIGTLRADASVLGELINVDVHKSLGVDDFVLRDDAIARTVNRRRINRRTGRIRRVQRDIYSWTDFDEYDKYLKDEDGTYLQFAPTLAFTRDTRDSITLPTSGSHTKLSGKLGLGTVVYGKGEVQHSSYFKLFETLRHRTHLPFSGAHVLETRGSAGFATENTPLFDRFFLGGPYELRGFGYRMAGPKDFSGDNPLGGTTKLFGSLEYTFPIYTITRNFDIRGAAWMDMGNVWWKSRSYRLARMMPDGNWHTYTEERNNFGEINMSAGLGLRVNMPIGPIRLDYGFPIVKDSESRDWHPLDGFSFNVGAAF